MRGDEFLEKMELVDPAYIEAADKMPPAGHRSRSRWIAAACLCLIVCLCAAFAASFLRRKSPGRPDDPLTSSEIEQQRMTELASAYGGTLLAANLALPDFRISKIRLTHSESGDISDPSTWSELSVTAEYDDTDLTLLCSFDDSTKEEPSSEPVEPLRYGDILVNIYQADAMSESENMYYAVFEYEGLHYELSTQVNDPDRITVLLERILGARLESADFTTDFSDISDPAANASDSLDSAAGVSDPSNPAAGISDPSDPAAGISGSSGAGWLPAASETAPAPSGAPDILPPLLGFTQYNIKIEEVSPWLFFWHYYAETANGEEQCIAEVFGPGDEPEAYIVDLDGDGITELVCNCEYGDSAKRVYIFRSKDGIIEEGAFNEDYYRTEFTNIDTMCGAARIVQKYDPEKKAFFVANMEAEELINQTFFMGLDYFNFRPFIHTK